MITNFKCVICGRNIIPRVDQMVCNKKECKHSMRAFKCKLRKYYKLQKIKKRSINNLKHGL
jgi:hypothetical protein